MQQEGWIQQEGLILYDRFMVELMEADHDRFTSLVFQSSNRSVVCRN